MQMLMLMPVIISIGISINIIINPNLILPPPSSNPRFQQPAFFAYL
jgi:hypothetical protein